MESIEERTRDVIIGAADPASPQDIGAELESLVQETRNEPDQDPEPPAPSPAAGTELEPSEEPVNPVVVRRAHMHSPPEIDRLAALWRGKYVIVLAAAVVGAAVYLISSASTPVYTSSATIGITAASTPGGAAQDVALASNDIAAQDAQLVKDDGVLAKASKSLGVPPSTLSSHLSAGTLASQNIVQITVQSSHPAQARAWVNGIAVAFQAYLIQRAQASSVALQNSVNVQVVPLDQQIAGLQLAIGAVSSAAPGTAAFVVLQNQENQLTGLVASRASLMESTALAIASQRPNVDVLQTASAPAKISPRPVFYGSLAAVAALFVAGQLVIVAARRRVPTVTRL